MHFFNNFSASSSSILFTGIPVHIETISAITSSFTVSFSLFELFQVLGKQYANHTNNEVKEILFDRIADIYVCKQMTLNNITNIRKRDIIDKIYGAIDSNINKYDANMFLIGGIS